MHFLIGGKVLRFGLLNFVLITRLNFGQYPNLAKINEMSTSRRPVETYMNSDVALKLTNLENAFLSCEDVEDGWKLDLCYLVEDLLLLDEQTSRVHLISFHSLRMRSYLFIYFSNIFGTWTHITRLMLV